jgi:hypothetical protein
MGWRGAAALVQRDVACRVHDLLQVPSWCSARNLLWSAIGQRAVCAPGRNAVVAAVCACVRARTRNKKRVRTCRACVCACACVCVLRWGPGGRRYRRGGGAVARRVPGSAPDNGQAHAEPPARPTACCQCCVLSDTCALSVACTRSALPKCGRGLSGIYRLAAATSAPGLDSPQPSPPGAWLQLPRLARGAPAAKVRIEMRRGSRARACAAELGVLALAAPWRVDLRVCVPRRDSTGGGV